jgi:hypothetical protein
MVIATQPRREITPAEETRLHGALESFFVSRAVFVLLAILSAVLPFSSRRWIWSPLVDRQDSWLLVGCALLVCSLSLVAAKQLSFEPRWRFALVPVWLGILALPDAFQRVAFPLGACGLAMTFSRPDLWNLWRRRPAYALRHVLLPAVRPSSPLSECETDEEAVQLARRQWRSTLLAIAGIWAFTLLTALFTYTPGLWQAIRTLEAAWSTGDRESLRALAAYPEVLDRELDALLDENGWRPPPQLATFSDQQRDPIRRMIFPDGELPVWRSEALVAGQWLSFDWIQYEGRWRLLAIGDPRERPGQWEEGERAMSYFGSAPR